MKIEPLFWVVSLSMVQGSIALADDVKPLPQAHAHNDYAHERPLFDALDNGFCNIEADVFLVNGKLLVGHTPFELKIDRTLQSLYLDPLLERARSNGGRVYKGGPTLTLLVDLKSQAEPTYAALRDILPKYAEMLGRYENGEWHDGAVRIVLSGNRPSSTVESEETRYVGIDGRTSDLDSSVPAHLMPMISDSWGTQFQWKGDGAIPEDQKAKLKDYVAKAHKAGRVVRFWATPEKESLWSELADAEVDLINTDDLPRLRKFLLERKK